MTETEKINQKPNRKRWIVIAFLLLLLLGLGTCALYTFMDSEEEETTSSVALMPDLDANAEDIATRKSFESAMQEKADASYFTLQINPDAQFSAATGEGTFELINPSSNVYPISFTITLDSTNEIIYESGTVMPHKQINQITLTKTPTAGTHKATVNVSIYNNDTHVKEGETQAKITLYVV